MLRLSLISAHVMGAAPDLLGAVPETLLAQNTETVPPVIPAMETVKTLPITPAPEVGTANKMEETPTPPRSGRPAKKPPIDVISNTNLDVTSMENCKLESLQKIPVDERTLAIKNCIQRINLVLSKLASIKNSYDASTNYHLKATEIETNKLNAEAYNEILMHNQVQKAQAQSLKLRLQMQLSHETQNVKGIVQSAKMADALDREKTNLNTDAANQQYIHQLMDEEADDQPKENAIQSQTAQLSQKLGARQGEVNQEMEVHKAQAAAQAQSASNRLHETETQLSQNLADQRAVQARYKTQLTRLEENLLDIEKQKVKTQGEAFRFDENLKNTVKNQANAQIQATEQEGWQRHQAAVEEQEYEEAKTTAARKDQLADLDKQKANLEAWRLNRRKQHEAEVRELQQKSQAEVQQEVKNFQKQLTSIDRELAQAKASNDHAAIEAAHELKREVKSSMTQVQAKADHLLGITLKEKEANLKKEEVEIGLLTELTRTHQQVGTKSLNRVDRNNTQSERIGERTLIEQIHRTASLTKNELQAGFAEKRQAAIGAYQLKLNQLHEEAKLIQGKVASEESAVDREGSLKKGMIQGQLQASLEKSKGDDLVAQERAKNLLDEFHTEIGALKEEGNQDASQSQKEMEDLNRERTMEEARLRELISREDQDFKMGLVQTEAKGQQALNQVNSAFNESRMKISQQTRENLKNSDILRNRQLQNMTQAHQEELERANEELKSLADRRSEAERELRALYAQRLHRIKDQSERVDKEGSTHELKMLAHSEEVHHQQADNEQETLKTLDQGIELDKEHHNVSLENLRKNTELQLKEDDRISELALSDLKIRNTNITASLDHLVMQTKMKIETEINNAEMDQRTETDLWNVYMNKFKNDLAAYQLRHEQEIQNTRAEHVSQTTKVRHASKRAIDQLNADRDLFTEYIQKKKANLQAKIATAKEGLKMILAQVKSELDLTASETQLGN